MLARDLRRLCGGLVGRSRTYAGVNELEVAGSESVSASFVSKDEKLEVIFGDAVEPFVKACAVFCTQRRHI